MEEVLNGYVTNPNPTLTPNPNLNPNSNPNVCWMENSTFIFADEQLYMVLYELQPC